MYLLDSILKLIVIGLTLIIVMFLQFRVTSLWVNIFDKFNLSKSILAFGQFVSAGIAGHALTSSFLSYCTNYLDQSRLAVLQLDFYLQLGKLALVLAILLIVLFKVFFLIFSFLTTSINEAKDFEDDNPRSAILLCGAIICLFYSLGPLFDSIFSYLISPSHEALIF
jgi:hypothetical protein